MLEDVAEKEVTPEELAEIIIFIKSKQAIKIDLSDAIDIAGTGGSGLPRINTSTLRVGLFGKKEKNGWGIITKGELVDIILIAKKAKMNAIQIHGICDFAYLKMYNFMVFQSININNINLSENENIDFYIIDGANPGSGEKYDYEKINKLNIEKKFLVAGGISEENVLEIYGFFKDNKYFCGVDIASGVDDGENIDLEKVKKIINKINKNV